MSDDNQNPNETQDNEPKPGTPEWDEAMAEKARAARRDDGNPYPDASAEETDEGSQEGDDNPQKPEGVPDKFWDAEKGEVRVDDLLKSYQELEKTRGQGQKTETEEGQEEAGQQAEDAAKSAAEKAGLDFQQLGEKVVANGDLEEADYKALQDAGIPEDLAKQHVELLKYRAETQRAQAIEYIGGEEEADSLLKWAASNLSADEIDFYNGQLSTSRWQAAVDTLRTLRGERSRSGQEPNLEQGSNATQGSTTGYQSKDDMRADMANPLYHQSGAEGDRFRAQVQRKMQFASWRQRR